MSKQTVQITPQQLEEIVSESVKRILKKSLNEGLFNWGRKQQPQQQQPQQPQQQNGGFKISQSTQQLINDRAQEIVSRARQHRFFNWDENMKEFLRQDPKVYDWVCREIEKAKSQPRQSYA